MPQSTQPDPVANEGFGSDDPLKCRLHKTHAHLALSFLPEFFGWQRLTKQLSVDWGKHRSAAAACCHKELGHHLACLPVGQRLGSRGVIWTTHPLRTGLGDMRICR